MNILKRRFLHWTPRYLWNRVREYIYQRTHPDLPWLTQAGNDFLMGYLKPNDRGVEFGSGRSTVWIARRVGELVSIEHDPQWFNMVQARLETTGLSSVDYRRLDVADVEAAEASDRILNVLQDLQLNSFEFVLIDGVWRDYCTKYAIPLLKPGGLLVIDNVNRYLPNSSHSPESRTLTQGPDGPLWGELADTLSNWRSYWTSSGVTDTAFFFKPID